MNTVVAEVFAKNDPKYHGWSYVSFAFGSWMECKCGFQPNSQEEMDAHYQPPVEACDGAFDMPLARGAICEHCNGKLEDHAWFSELLKEN